jgi:hypothetical protein
MSRRSGRFVDGYLIDHGISGVVNIYRQRDGALTRIASGSAAGLDPAAFQHVSVRITIWVSWRQDRERDRFVMDLTAPTGTTGTREVAR